MIKTEMAENEINIMSEEDLFKGHVDEKQGSSKNWLGVPQKSTVL